VPDITKNVWLDTTFNRLSIHDKDVSAELQLYKAENIGNYSIPVIYRAPDSVLEEIDTLLSYFQEFNSVSGVINVPIGYYTTEPPKINGVIVSLVEFNNDYITNSGTLNNPVIYTTGYNKIFGEFDKYVTFIGGRERLDFKTILSIFWNIVHKDEVMEWWVNYTNFSGNLTTSGTPIVFYDSDLHYIVEYNGSHGTTSGMIGTDVDVSFAGWVDFPVNCEIYSTLEGFVPGYEHEVTTISGHIGIHYMDLYSTILTYSGIKCDMYCALTEYVAFDTDITTISGRIGYLDTDIFSCAEVKDYLTIDVELYSLYITNFFPSIGECTIASGSIYVDVMDSECPVSMSNTYFMVNDIRVPVTFSVIENGYRMFYNPDDDFASIEGSTVFTVHAENECDKILEQDFYLTSGYIVEYINREELIDSTDYGFSKKIVARVTAENYASCPQITSLAWDFESKTQPNNDLTASITGKFHASEYNDMQAIIYPHSTAYFYGKEFKVVVKAKDFAGNQMEPLILNYRIEDKP